MKITKADGPPKDILSFDNLEAENELNLTPAQVEDVAEIFNTPLTGAYNWDYTIADNRIKKLYELGKELNWNGSIDLNWDYTHPANERLVQADEELPHETLEAYENLTEEEKIEFDRHDTAELLSQFLHGEQGALLVASQLTSCAPTYNAKLYAASQTFDEARHVTFGINYLEDFIKTLSPEEIEDRAEFAYEACVISRERLINTTAMQKYLKMSEDEAREFALSTSANTTFRNFLFSRIMPNLSRIGLLTDKVRPKFEALGLLEYENAPDDFECDWDELEKPLEKFGEIPQAI